MRVLQKKSDATIQIILFAFRNFFSHLSFLLRIVMYFLYWGKLHSEGMRGSDTKNVSSIENLIHSCDQVGDMQFSKYYELKSLTLIVIRMTINLN